MWKVFVNHKICKHTMFIAYTIIFMMTWNVKCLSIWMIMEYYKNQSCFVYQLRFLVMQYMIQDSIKNCQYLLKLYKNFVTNCYNYNVIEYWALYHIDSGYTRGKRPCFMDDLKTGVLQIVCLFVQHYLTWMNKMKYFKGENIKK